MLWHKVVCSLLCTSVNISLQETYNCKAQTFLLYKRAIMHSSYFYIHQLIIKYTIRRNYFLFEFLLGWLSVFSAKKGLLSSAQCDTLLIITSHTLITVKQQLSCICCLMTRCFLSLNHNRRISIYKVHSLLTSLITKTKLHRLVHFFHNASLQVYRGRAANPRLIHSFKCDKLYLE